MSVRSVIKNNIIYSQLRSEYDSDNDELCTQIPHDPHNHDTMNYQQKFDNNSFNSNSLSNNSFNNNSTEDNLENISKNNADRINHKDFPEYSWYSELISNVTTFPNITMPDFVTTYTESLSSNTYSDDVLYTIPSGKINHSTKFIYLVHGRKGHPTDLDYISIYLQGTTDYNIILTYIPNSKECSIETGANILKKIILDTHGEINKDNDVTIIAHSKGGVISMYLNEFLTENKINKIMTIASPINGTAIASYAGDFYTRTELSFNSECLKMINRMIKTNDTTLYYHVAVEKDHVIIPSITSAIPDGHRKDQCSIIKNVCHVSVLYSNALMEILNMWID